VFFDRRIWHTRSRNYSQHTRKAVFFGYTYRWTATRDDIAPIRASGWFGRLTPVQQQLLGGAEDLPFVSRADRLRSPGGDHAWGHDPAATPLYGWLKERGFLDPANPPLQP
jgi:ectoine hydroxylase-related dioxygenase (phytanoyl-CoA dioxygenase family)